MIENLRTWYLAMAFTSFLKIINEQSIVISDKSTKYVDIADQVEDHLTEKSDETTTRENLKWLYIAISNSKRTFLGIYHKIEGKYLQNYLNQLVYKFNRRYFCNRIFDRLLVAVTHQYWCKRVLYLMVRPITFSVIIEQIFTVYSQRKGIPHIPAI